MIESYLTAILNSIRAIRAVKLGADILAFSNIQIQFRRGYILPDLTSIKLIGVWQQVVELRRFEIGLWFQSCVGIVLEWTILGFGNWKLYDRIKPDHF